MSEQSSMEANMIDPVSLGLTAAALFSTKLLEKLAEKTGEGVAEAIAALRDKIGKLLETNESATGAKATDRVESAPDSRIAIDALAAEIAKAAEKNPAGAKDLSDLVVRLQSDLGNQHGATFQVNAADRARIGRIYQANRDINFGSE